MTAVILEASSDFQLGKLSHLIGDRRIMDSYVYRRGYNYWYKCMMMIVSMFPTSYTAVSEVDGLMDG